MINPEYMHSVCIVHVRVNMPQRLPLIYTLITSLAGCFCIRRG